MSYWTYLNGSIKVSVKWLLEHNLETPEIGEAYIAKLKEEIQKEKLI